MPPRDRNVLPLRVLRQPPAERVVDRQAVLGLRLEEQHRGEGLGVAADLQTLLGRTG
jgi:hypothetical protein